MQAVYILSAVRTPIGKFGGSLASLTAADMGVVAAKAALERAGVQPRSGRRNHLRQRAPGRRRPESRAPDFGPQRRAAGSPRLHRQQGLRFRHEVDRARPIRRSRSATLSCVLAGGTESMSRLPYYLDGARWGYRLGNQELVDGMYRDGFFCPTGARW